MGPTQSAKCHATALNVTIALLESDRAHQITCGGERRTVIPGLLEWADVALILIMNDRAHIC